MTEDYTRFEQNVVDRAYRDVEEFATLAELRELMRNNMAAIIKRMPTRAQLDYAMEYLTKKKKVSEARRPTQKEGVALLARQPAPYTAPPATIRLSYPEPKPPSYEIQVHQPQYPQAEARQEFKQVPVTTAISYGRRGIIPRLFDAVSSLWKRIFG